jgi:hypothetical protein
VRPQVSLDFFYHNHSKNAFWIGWIRVAGTTWPSDWQETSNHKQPYKAYKREGIYRGKSIHVAFNTYRRDYLWPIFIHKDGIHFVINQLFISWITHPYTLSLSSCCFKSNGQLIKLKLFARSSSRGWRLEISYLRFSTCYEDRNTTIRFRNKRSTNSER